MFTVWHIAQFICGVIIIYVLYLCHGYYSLRRKRKEIDSIKKETSRINAERIVIEKETLQIQTDQLLIGGQLEYFKMIEQQFSDSLKKTISNLEDRAFLYELNRDDITRYYDAITELIKNKDTFTDPALRDHHRLMAIQSHLKYLLEP